MTQPPTKITKGEANPRSDSLGNLINRLYHRGAWPKGEFFGRDGEEKLFKELDYIHGDVNDEKSRKSSKEAQEKYQVVVERFDNLGQELALVKYKRVS